MKKSLYFIAALALPVCLSAQAAQPTDNDPFALSIPDLNGGLQMNVGGALNKSSGTGPGASSDSSNAQVSPQAGVGYGIPGSGNDVQMQWNSGQ
ncbi:MAG TPA: hypothetical protein VHE99_08815 [Gammaproteobacteria bacterium]|nr:hypothetical protein [Gammaproteobacteria bacterium]